MDLWVAWRDSDSSSFLRTENLGPTVNSPGYDGEPSISADGFYLFFSSDRPGGNGQRDLWMAARRAHSVPFRVPRNLGRLVNSPCYDVRPSISADGSTLFFMSNRSGGSGHIDLWQKRTIARGRDIPNESRSMLQSPTTRVAHF